MLRKPRPPSRRVLFLFLLRRPQRSLSTTTTTTSSSSSSSSAISEAPPPFVVEEYLVSSCGLSPSAASRASRSLAHVKSPHKPDSVLRFLRSRGFDEPCLRRLLSWRPNLLCSDVDKTLAPKLRGFEDLGFRSADLPRILSGNPRIFHLSLDRTIRPRIRLLVGVIGSVDLLAKVLKCKTWFLTFSTEKKILPNLAYLRDCGLSGQTIVALLRRHPSFILRKPESLRGLVARVEGLGIPCSSPAFPQVLWALHFVSKARLKGMLDRMKSFGWTEAQFLAAFQKAPTFLTVSEKRISAKMEFFVKDAGFEPSLIACRPELLTFSLEKRIIPRHRVLSMLKSRGLCKREYKISTLVVASEKTFVKYFIAPYKKELPELQEMYTAECCRQSGKNCSFSSRIEEC